MDFDVGTPTSSSVSFFGAVSTVIELRDRVELVWIIVVLKRRNSKIDRSLDKPPTTSSLF